MSTPNLYDGVALLHDMPEEKLRRGHVGALVHEHNNGEAFIVEFVDTKGHTYGLVTLKPEEFVVLTREPSES